MSGENDASNAAGRIRASQAVVDFLRQPEAYPVRPNEAELREVELRETHISWVFLAGEQVYKLKKPVRYDFVDFSTLALRRAACQAEVELNRRLAPDVYLGMVPVTRDAGGALQLGGDGEPLDWLVHMRRLPDEQALDRRIAEGRLGADQVEALGRKLAGFYAKLPPLPLAPEEYLRHIVAHVEGNRDAMLAEGSGLDCDSVHRANAAQLRLLRTRGELLEERVRGGRVVDGHGDLRPEHVYLDHEATVIDCLEFNAELRQIDVLDELGFLAMECDELGAGEVGRRVIHCYLEASGDAPPEVLLPFYKSYRACVRAKVISLHAQQLAGKPREREMARAADYLRLADRYAADVAGPLLLVVRGLSGTGKTTLAIRLAESLGAELVSTDAVRRELLGAEEAPAAYGQDRYSPQNRARVYDEMHRRAAELIGKRLSVILDGTYLSAAQRGKALELGQRHGAAVLVIDCVCPAEEAQRRIGQRLQQGGSLSEATPEILERQRQDEQPDPPGLPAIKVDTTQGIDEQLAAVFACLAGPR